MWQGRGNLVQMLKDKGNCALEGLCVGWMYNLEEEEVGAKKAKKDMPEETLRMILDPPACLPGLAQGILGCDNP